MATKSSSAKSSEENFENAMSRLEVVVAQMESDQLPLEELIARYEEGIKLVKLCEEKLTTAEKRIEIITRDSAGEAQVEPFEPGKKSALNSPEDASLF